MKSRDIGYSMHFKRVASFSLIAILISMLVVEARLASSEQKPKPKAVSSQQKTEDLYRTNCARCHGLEGRGDTPLGQQYDAPDFTDKSWWKDSEKTNSRSLSATVNNGKGKMPAFSEKLKSSEIALLVKYIRRFRNQPAITQAQKN
jgi:mono/diheme cytochrome c family protein